MPCVCFSIFARRLFGSTQSSAAVDIFSATMDPSSTGMASTLFTEAVFIVQLVRCVVGQHVTLDVQLPAPWSRVHQRADPPLLVRVQQHLEQFQQQWPLEVQGHRLGNYSFRTMFTHTLPRQCAVYVSVSRAWYSAVSYRVPDMGHVNYRAPRPLHRQYEVVDTITSHDSESEFHGQNRL